LVLLLSIFRDKKQPGQSCCADANKNGSSAVLLIIIVHQGASEQAGLQCHKATTTAILARTEGGQQHCVQLTSCMMLEQSLCIIILLHPQ